MEEIWKTIEDFPNYEVSIFGNIKNKTSGKLLKPSLNSSGYYRCTLINNLKKKTITIHRIVSQIFLPNPENKPTVNHIDRNKINNNLKNLEWATYIEQNLHKSKSTKIRRHALKVTRISCETNNVLEMYNSLKEAAEWVINSGLSKIKNNNFKSVMSKISAVINNKIHCNTSFGYKWSIYNNDIAENEIWKQIPLYLTNNIKHYYISNYGKIKIRKTLKHNFGIINGYQVVSIMKTHFYVHRLVALAFLENPENKEYVNHKDGNKLNNSLDNLEWATCPENNIHAIETGLSKRRKRIIQYDLNMNKIQEFNSITECVNTLNIGKSCISDNCRGKTKSTKCGFIFRYAETETETIK
jgi:hypothetical protein